MNKLDELKKRAEAATPGPWIFATSNSWRRISTSEKDGGVICPTVYSDRDRHPDLLIKEADGDYIAAASPATVLKLLEIIKVQRRGLSIVAARSDGIIRGLAEEYLKTVDELERSL